MTSSKTATPLREFLEIPYDRLEEMNLAGKEARTKHESPDQMREERVRQLTDERGVWRIRHAAYARAVENQMFVCVSPVVGDLGIPVERPLHACGGAFVACPIDNRFAIDDGTLARAEENVESVLHARLDLALLRKSRERSEITHLNDRRSELYAALRSSIRPFRNAGE